MYGVLNGTGGKCRAGRGVGEESAETSPPIRAVPRRLHCAGVLFCTPRFAFDSKTLSPEWSGGRWHILTNVEGRSLLSSTMLGGEDVIFYCYWPAQSSIRPESYWKYQPCRMV